MSNLEIWNTFADIDPKFTKPISGKDYGGTSPNAHYVIRCLTELFGPVGKGFGWRVVAESIDRFGETAIHWCRIEFWHTDRANTFEAYGQTKMAYKTSKGYIKVDEDAPKKSLTDAITKAAAQVGIASNIFMGRWDDNQYVQNVNDEYRKREKPELSDDEKVATLVDIINSKGDALQLTNWWGSERTQGALKRMSEEAAARVQVAYDERISRFEANAQEDEHDKAVAYQ